MLRSRRSRFVFCSLLSCSLLVGCTSYRAPSDGNARLDNTPIEYSGGLGKYGEAENIDTGFFVPDGRGNNLHVKGKERRAPDAGYTAAQEIRLKARELATQLLDNGGTPIAGMIALPTSFLDLNNFTESNPLGRYLAEAMFHEFTQRGVPVQEYRLKDKIQMVEGRGEFALSRSLAPVAIKQGWAVALVGTYLKDDDGVFVNVRLVRPSDGLVLRTGQLVLQNNSVLTRMAGAAFPAGTIQVQPQVAPVKAKTVKKSTKRRRATARKTTNSAAITPSFLPDNLSTQDMQARQAAHMLATQPNVNANSSASTRARGNQGNTAAQGNSNGMYSGPAQAIPDSTGGNPSPIPGSPRNT